MNITIPQPGTTLGPVLGYSTRKDAPRWYSESRLARPNSPHATAMYGAAIDTAWRRSRPRPLMKGHAGCCATYVGKRKNRSTVDNLTGSVHDRAPAQRQRQIERPRGRSKTRPSVQRQNRRSCSPRLTYRLCRVWAGWELWVEREQAAQGHFGGTPCDGGGCAPRQARGRGARRSGTRGRSPGCRARSPRPPGPAGSRPARAGAPVRGGCPGTASLRAVNTPLCRHTSAIHSALRPVQPKVSSAFSRPLRCAITATPRHERRSAWR